MKKILILQWQFPFPVVPKCNKLRINYHKLKELAGMILLVD